MTTITAEALNRLQDIIEYPHSKREELLSSVLNALPENTFHEVVNLKLPHVTPLAVRTLGIACFDRLDIRPTPPDGYISIDEVAELIARSGSPDEQAVLLYIWLNFERIRQASEDFDGTDKLFDYVLTRADFASFN